MPCKGWLKNEKRKYRRDSPGTLSDKAALEAIDLILTSPEYTKLEPEIDQLIRLRDACAVAVGQTFFRRGNEILGIRFGDAYLSDNELSLTLHIEKKQKTLKHCPTCQKKNAKRANFCRYCGESLKDIEAELYGDKQVQTMVLNKSRNYVFVKHIENWLAKLEKLHVNREAWLFPRYHYFSRAFLWHSEKPITIQRLDQILQAIDPTLSSCMFRYGGAENKLRLGYTPYELKEIGGWSSSKMPEIYAQRKGLAPSQKKFTDDNRTV